MLRQRRIRKLSKALKETQKEIITYAWCGGCGENFIDDLPYHVLCPNGCGFLLQKGYEKPYKLRKVRAKSKSKVSRKDARKAARKNRDAKD